MRIHRNAFFLITALSVFTLASAAQARLGRVTFHFQPPAGTTCVETQHTTRIKDLGSRGKQTTVSEDQYQTTFAEAPAGYTMTIRKLSSKVIHEGKPVEGAMSEKVKGLAITHELSRDGRIQTIRGQEAIIAQIKASLPPDKAAAADKLFNEKALTQRAQLAWHSRLSRLIGQSLARKEVLITREALALPTGHVADYYLATRFVDDVPCGAGRCAKLQLVFGSDLESLKRRLGRASLKISDDSTSAGLPVMTQAEVTGDGEQVVDPATMLLYAERVSRAVSWPMSGSPDDVLRTRLEEQQQTSFNYLAGEKQP